uniref:ATP synthase complex subunit 8 n=1 Tax=Phycodurus eques TaxID=693459 RepID=A0A060NSL0_PHYEQ|nr:ATP synthase F0 subunit 8 [Phycodurus eques]WIL09500.1 ATP synthase F0 subunit 8 [Phycodurus eques]WIL09890.1 ATP synthase F0 subunit 8 [Phycodurus eques]WIL09903.1 ATP synthase F0 subunit 8 [Phycodurus eques]WIL09916.1 ATP synthase F0 subunit 8 [Phycodurus eques]WIL09929.1 ATP synthase F0 subunit 8 [Phycodurus eques]
MPQLNPYPWFAVLIFTWLVLTTILPPKILSHKFTNEPNAQATKAPKTLPWNWQWH